MERSENQSTIPRRAPAAACGLGWMANGDGRDVVPDIVNLVIWLLGGLEGGNAAGELLKGDYDLGPGNSAYGAVGGVVGAFIVQAMIPALKGIDYGPIIGQAIAAAASGAILTTVVGAVKTRRQTR